MMTQIAISAGEIWLLLDKHEGISLNELFRRLEKPERSKDLLLMAFGWLIYEKHVKWVQDEDGGRLFLVNSKVKEGVGNEKSDQNNFAVNNA